MSSQSSSPFPFQCHICGQPIQSPHEHHRQEHPDAEYDPKQYIGDVTGESEEGER